MGKILGIGSSKKDDEDRTASGSSTQNTTTNASNGNKVIRVEHHDDADERTRLLPSQASHGVAGRPPLDPDDPAVTPLNLWSVRFLRYFTLFFFVLTAAWWLFLLITTFVSPPGVHSRGGGWFEFGYTTLSLGILALLLFSFTEPSRAEEVLQSIVAVLLLVNLIIICSVPGLRKEEGWTGIASVIWVSLVTIWAVVVDRTVEWGKREEEERLTGRAESRRTLKQWCGVFGALAVIIVFLAITILFTGTLSLRAHDLTLEVPGKKVYVDDGSYQVHVYCTPKHGNNTKREQVSVFLEGGERAVGNGLLDWGHENYVNGNIGRLCYWDRPGYGFSDVAPSPLSAGMAADALSEALANLGEEGPWVLVSHGVGSIYSRIFASRHGSAVKGLLFIDPLHEDYLRNLGSPGRGFFMWFRGVISPLGLEALLGWVFKHQTREDRVYGGASYLNPRVIKAKLQESLAARTFTRTEIATSRAILSKDIPLIVVSSGEHVKRSSEWDDKQKQLTKVTDNLLYWDVVNKAPHKVWEAKAGWSMLSNRVGQLIDTALKTLEV